MATKFRMRPATVTRENAVAAIGSSASSAQIVAVNRAVSGCAIQVLNPPSPTSASSYLLDEWLHPHKDSERRSERQQEAGVNYQQRGHARQAHRRQREGVDGRRPMIHCHRAQEHRGRKRRPCDRRLGADDRAIHEQASNGHHRGGTPRASEAAQPQQQCCRQDRDVAARDRDDVIGAGLL